MGGEPEPEPEPEPGDGLARQSSIKGAAEAATIVTGLARWERPSALRRARSDSSGGSGGSGGESPAAGGAGATRETGLRLDLLSRARSATVGLTPDELPPTPGSEDIYIPEFRQSSDLTAMGATAAEHQRTPPARLPSQEGRQLQYIKRASFDERTFSGSPRRGTAQTVEPDSPSAPVRTESNEPSDGHASTGEKEESLFRFQRLWTWLTTKLDAIAAEDVLWWAGWLSLLALVLLLICGGIGCHGPKHLFPSGHVHSDVCTGTAAGAEAQQCDRFPKEETVTQVERFLGQLDKKLDHVRQLRTDMDYLRTSKLRQERHLREEITLFQHQSDEIQRTKKQIDSLKAKLVGLDAVRETTVLSCDWLDDSKIPFANDEKLLLNRTGCHVPVEREIEELSGDDDDKDTNAGNFDCFDTEGQPQGCHAYAKQRLAQARFRVGCSLRGPTGIFRLDIRRWGWCGKYPWSQLSGPWQDSQASPADVYEASQAGCTTLMDILRWIFTAAWDYGAVISAGSAIVYNISRTLRSLQSGVDIAKKGVQNLEERASGKHAKQYVNRVSLSLNYLDPETDANGMKTGKMKLNLRTLWEKTLMEIINEQEPRQSFRAAAMETKQDKPFLEDDKSSSDRGAVLNLFANHISSICSTNFILQDMGQHVREESFVFGLTFEEAPGMTDNDKAQTKTKKSDQNHVKKIRVLMVRESTLTELSQLEEKDIKFQSKSNYHQMRFKHLKLMAREWEAMKRMKSDDMYIYIGKLRLCVPVSYGGAGPEVLESSSSRSSTPSSKRSESPAPLPSGISHRRSISSPRDDPVGDASSGIPAPAHQGRAHTPRKSPRQMPPPPREGTIPVEPEPES